MMPFGPPVSLDIYIIFTNVKDICRIHVKMMHLLIDIATWDTTVNMLVIGFQRLHCDHKLCPVCLRFR